MSVRFAANLSMLFGELAWEDRFAAAAHAGFDAVEAQFPYVDTPEVLAARLAEAALPLVLINTPPCPDQPCHGRAAGGREALRADLDRTLPYLQATGAQRLHVMAGPGDLGRRDVRDAFEANLAWAADRLAPIGVTAVIEPLNPHDVPGYALADFDLAGEILDAVGRPNLKLMFDAYHFERIHGGAAEAAPRFARHIGHVQIAGAPSRNEPDRGAPNLAALLAALRAIDYRGAIGAEYRPAGDTVEGLGWLKAVRQGCA